jgi:hypothetical protein
VAGEAHHIGDVPRVWQEGGWVDRLGRRWCRDEPFMKCGREEKKDRGDKIKRLRRDDIFSFGNSKDRGSD